jgi:hypothetical protein
VVDECAQILLELGPYVKPPPYTAPQPTPPTDKPKKRKPPSKEFLGKRRNMRTAELKVLVRYLPRADLTAIVAAFPGRDVYDPADVDRREIGDHVKLTKDEMFEIEQSATDHGLQRKWGRPGKPYRFSFRTITCYDLTDEAVRLDRKDRSDKRTKQRLKTERWEKKTMQATMQQTQPMTNSTYSSVMEAMMANVRAQEESLYDAIRGDDTIADLMKRVRSDPCWLLLASGKPESFRRKVSDRLDALEKAGRIVSNYSSGRRVIRRV